MMFEQRMSERYVYSGDDIEYVMDPFADDEPFQATVLDYNESGICLLSPRPLKIEQEITIKDFLDYSSRSAVVVWIAKHDDMFYMNNLGETLYRVGLLFT